MNETNVTVPKPKPFVPQPVIGEEFAVTELRAKINRPDYVLKPHMTDRPLRNNDELAALRLQLAKANHPSNRNR